MPPPTACCLVFPTLAPLMAYDDSSLTDNCQVRVQSVDDYFVLYKTATDTADGITIVNSLSSVNGTLPGRWVRQPSFSLRSIKQHVWFVDSVNGDNEWDGKTPTTPIRDSHEVNRRLWILEGGGRYIIKYLSPPVLGDSPRLLATYHSAFPPKFNTAYRNDEVVFNGYYTLVTTGVVAAATRSSYSTNEIWSITDASQNWDTYIAKNYAIRFTSGPLTGCFAIPSRNLGSGRVSIANPYLNDFELTTRQTIFATVAPNPGDTYEIVSFMDCPELELARHVASANPTHVYEFMNFKGDNLTPMYPNEFQDFTRGPATTAFYHCRFPFAILQVSNSTGIVHLNACNVVGSSSPTDPSCWTLSGRARGAANACVFHKEIQVITYGTNVSLSTCVHKRAVWVRQEASVLVQSEAIMEGPGTPGTAFQVETGATFTVLAGTKIIGSGWTVLFYILKGAKVTLFYDDLAAGRYSVQCVTNSILWMNGFGYGNPLGQLSQPPIALPIGGALTQLNVSPWLVPAVPNQNPASVTVWAVDGETKFMAL